MNEEQFYQKIKNSIKEKKLIIDAVSFQPVMKIVLELPLEPATDSSIGKQKLHELIGMAILEAQVETSGPPTGKIFDLSKKYKTL
jgi:hypothetical protein